MRMNSSTSPRIEAMDSHIHLDMYAPEDMQRLLAKAKESGVRKLVAVSRNLQSCRATRAIFQAFPGQIVPAYGFHPEQPLPDAAEVDALIAWMLERRDEYFAIGEVGLPYYMRRDAEKMRTAETFPNAAYLELLERFVMLARMLERPIVLHAVYEDADAACDLLEKHGVTRAHFHWFKGATATIERMIGNGYYVSVTPDVLYEPKIQALVRQYPLDRIMTETDGPWPFEGPFAGKQTHPAMVLDVAAAIAELKALPYEETASALYGNAVRFYCEASVR